MRKIELRNGVVLRYLDVQSRFFFALGGLEAGSKILHA